MKEAGYDKAWVQHHVAQVRKAFAHPDVADRLNRASQVLTEHGVAAPLDELHKALEPTRTLDSPSSGQQPAGVPYMSRSPIISLIQSTVEQTLLDEGIEQPPPPSHRTALDRFVYSLRKLVHFSRPFRSGDPGWYIGIAQGVLDRVIEHNHAFNDAPAELAIDDRARIVLVGDWGSGLPRAQRVAAQMAIQIDAALAEQREVHVIHLGDVYYSGVPEEDRRHFLDFWPVTADRAAAGATSWSLNGNHDMYSGGHGYFETLLGDPRFARQRSADGATSSYFRLHSPSWEFVGLDTAYDPSYFWTGESAQLRDPQAGYVSDLAKARGDRKMVLLSHHQLVSAYEQSDISPVLANKLAPVLDAKAVTAWWWGHEHRAVVYEPAGGVQFPRCLGNGGVPVTVDGPPPTVPGVTVKWHSHRSDTSDGTQWTRFGFAVLDLDGPRMHVRYIDDDGDEPYAEDVE